jgi:hypothetical protein
LFAPSIIDAKRQAPKFKRSEHFFTGELTRLCQGSLRQSDGRWITAIEIAITVLHAATEARINARYVRSSPPGIKI